MSMMSKKKITELTSKKLAPERLIKCYVCNKLFNTQNEFSEHLQQHQSKLNRTNIQEIQRKTHESFRSKKMPSKILGMTSNNTTFQSKSSKETLQQESKIQKQIEIQKDQQEQLSIALKQSQILLEKIQFLTQINYNEDQKQQKQQKDQQQIQEIHLSIDNERQLYRQLLIKNNKKPQKLILSTKFQTKYFENYQSQLQHLIKLSQFSINTASIQKIQQIIAKICKDVFLQLQTLYKQEQKTKEKRKQSALDFWVLQASSQIYYCSQCYSQIEMGQEFHINDQRIAYHKDCFKQIFQ